MPSAAAAEDAACAAHGVLAPSAAVASERWTADAAQLEALEMLTLVLAARERLADSLVSRALACCSAADRPVRGCCCWSLLVRPSCWGYTCTGRDAQGVRDPKHINGRAASAALLSTATAVLLPARAISCAASKPCAPSAPELPSCADRPAGLAAALACAGCADAIAAYAAVNDAAPLMGLLQG